MPSQYPPHPSSSLQQPQGPTDASSSSSLNTTSNSLVLTREGTGSSGGGMRTSTSGFEVLSRGGSGGGSANGIGEEEVGESGRGRDSDFPVDVLSITASPPPSSQPKPLPPSAIELVPPTPTTPTTPSFGASTTLLPLPKPSLRRKLSDSLLSLRAMGDSWRESFRLSPSPLPSASSASSEAAPTPTGTAPVPSPSPPASALSGLISRFAASPPVKLVVVNETGLELSLAYWPVRKDEGGYEMKCFRGGGIVEGSIDGGGHGVAGTWTDTEKEVGTMRRPVKGGILGGNEHEEGWIFLDLSLPSSDPTTASISSPSLYRIHLALYLRLSTSLSARAALGRFDLDASTEKPLPSGRCGRVEVVRERRGVVEGIGKAKEGLGRGLGLRREQSETKSLSGLSLAPTIDSTTSRASGDSGEKIEKDTAVEDGEVTEVRFILTPDVVDVRNHVDVSTKEGSRFWLPSKGVVVSSWVSVEGVSLSLLLGKEARYHEFYSSTSSHHHPHPSPFGPHHSSTLLHRRSASSFLSTSTTFTSSEPRLHKLSTSSSSSLSTLALAARDLASEHPMRTSKHVLEGLGEQSVYFSVSKDREVLLEREVRISTLSGSSIGTGVVSVVETPTAFHRHPLSLAVSYGFFDSGIARAKQMYIYVASLNTTWLATMIEEDERVLSVPFEKLALAGAHDAGMLGLVSRNLLDFLARGNGADIPAVALALPIVRFVLGLLRSFGVGASRMLANMSMTQKDSVRGMLDMGVRFFDFRPGYSLFDIVDEVKGELRHQHSIVPGVSYTMFLLDILAFLAENEKEIVVVELKDDGFPFKTDIFPDLDPSLPSSPSSAPPKPTTISMIPTTAELLAALDAAKASSPLAARAVYVGSAKDLARTVGELLCENRRLIIIDRVHEEDREEGDRWERADSYTHEMYDTDDETKIVAALTATHAEAASRPARGSDGPRSTVYQLQATPTADIWADVGASLTYSNASSLLIWSKARVDRVTYPWLAQRAFVEEGLVVFLNDFVDVALVQHAIDKSRERAAVFLAKRDRAEEAESLRAESMRAPSEAGYDE